MEAISEIGSNLYGLTTGAINAPLQIGNTAVHKSTSLIDSALGSTLDTVRIVNSSAQEIVQQTAETTSKISRGALNTTGIVTTSALGVVDVNAENAASIINTTSTEGTKVTNEAVQQSGRLAKTTLSLAGTALYNLLGTADNLALSHSQSIRATSEMTTAMYNETLVTKLNSKIKGIFRTRMNELIDSLHTYSANQNVFINNLIDIYQTINCNKGRMWGYKCSPGAHMVVNEFVQKLKVAMKRSRAHIVQLKGITEEIDSTLVTVYGEENTLDNYKIRALDNIKPFYKKSADLYIKIVVEFGQLTAEIDEKLHEKLQEKESVQENLTGGRTRRRRKRRRTKKR
jgi:hypothetical protein